MWPPSPALRRITSPALTPVTLIEAKAHLRVDFPDDDALITALISAAAGSLDPVGRPLVETQWALDLDAFPGFDTTCGGRFPYGSIERPYPDFHRLDGPAPFDRQQQIRLPAPPLVAVTAVKYRDSASVVQTLDPSIYTTFVADGGIGWLRLANAMAWPATDGYARPVSIEFTSGYGGSGGSSVPLPGAMRAAVLLIIGGLYEQRSSFTDKSVFTNPAVEMLVSPFRVMV